MFQSYHETFDPEPYEYAELLCQPRYSGVVEIVRQGDRLEFMSPDGSCELSVLGYLTDVSEDNGSAQLFLLVSRYGDPRPPYEEVASMVL